MYIHPGLQSKEALAYGVYACTNTFLPTAVAALVLFYGGNLVLQGQMSAGALVSFMLYQQSLASAFQVNAVSNAFLPVLAVCLLGGPELTWVQRFCLF